MQTTIHENTPAEYTLEIRVEAEELEPRLDKALRAQRVQTQMNGFRKGKVPLSLVKKMFGNTIGLQVAEQHVQEVFQQEVQDNGEYNVMGQAKITALEFDSEGDLNASISFGVFPKVTLKELEGEEVEMLVYEITEVQIEQEIEQLRMRHAELAPLDDDEVVGEQDYVLIDVQQLDASSGTPIIGEVDKDVSFFLDDERLREELRDELLGRKEGDSFRAELPHIASAHEGAEHAHAGEHTHFYEITIKEAKHRDLPELDEAFITEVTEERVKDEAELRSLIRTELERQWKEQEQNFTRGKIMKRMLDLHPVTVPASAIDSFLDAFVSDVRRRNEGNLPDDFDEELFRGANRDEAEQQARWMLIRDQFVAVEGIEVTDADMNAFYAKRAEEMEEDITGEQLRQVYQSMENLKDQIEQQLLSDKVFARLKERLDMVARDVETLRAESEGEAASTLVT